MAKAHIDYLELWAKDISNSRAFYEQAFGWKFTEWGDDYISFNDTNRDEAGGIAQTEKRQPPTTILKTDDLNQVKQQVIKAGGKILGDDIEFPGGRRFHFTDPAGNELAVWMEVKD